MKFSSGVSEGRAASIFRWLNLVQVEAKWVGAGNASIM